jgi:hypothetical protein
LIVLLPSTYLAYQLVRKTIFEQSAKRFVANECSFAYRQVVNFVAQYNRRQSRLELTMVGEPLPPDSINVLRSKMLPYGLGDTRLVVKQGSFKEEDINVESLKTTIADQVIQYSQSSIARKDQTIDSLRRYIELTQTSRLPVADLRNELKTLMPDVETFTAARSLLMNTSRPAPDTVMLVYAKFSRRHTLAERNRIQRWLQTRTKSKRIKLIVE